MLYYSGEDLARIVNKVLGTRTYQLVSYLIVICTFLHYTLALCICGWKGLGVEKVAEWLEMDIVGCLQQFFMDCQTGDFLKDREVQQ